MSLAQVGVPGQQVDVLHGGDVDPTGRLLSVAEIQQVLRELRQRRVAHGAGPANVTGVRPAADIIAGTPDLGDPADARPDTAGPGTAGPDTAAPGGPDTAGTAVPDRPDTAQELDDNSTDNGRVASDWIVVLAAHAGAGASTVALAITDALSASDRPARLVETARPSRSGLAAAAAVEFGIDATGAWRRGTRGSATVWRRANNRTPDGWPTPADAAPADDVLTVVDLGRPARQNLARLAADRPRLVMVCRPTIPGVRAAEQLLAQLDRTRAVVAAVGARRWPTQVLASLGPLVSELRDDDRVVTVPEERQLRVTGPSHLALPSSVTAAGNAVLRLLEPAAPTNASMQMRAVSRWTRAAR